MLTFKQFIKEGIVDSLMGKETKAQRDKYNADKDAQYKQENPNGNLYDKFDKWERSTRNVELPFTPPSEYIKKNIQKGTGNWLDKPLFKGVMGNSDEKPLTPEQQKLKDALPTK